MTFTMTKADGDKQLSSTGTWKIIDGAIHSTTLELDELPGMPALELPYLSVEKIVSLQAHEYRYVCPVQGIEGDIVADERLGRLLRSYRRVA